MEENEKWRTERTIIKKEIKITFKIRGFNNPIDRQTGETVYTVDEMINDIQNYLKNRVLNELLPNEAIDISKIPEEYEYIDDLVDMDILINNEVVNQFTRK
jgi:hypothetical protein